MKPENDCKSSQFWLKVSCKTIKDITTQLWKFNIFDWFWTELDHSSHRLPLQHHEIHEIHLKRLDVRCSCDVCCTKHVGPVRFQKQNRKKLILKVYSEVSRISISVSSIPPKQQQLYTGIYSASYFPVGHWSQTVLAEAGRRDVYLTLQGDNPSSVVVQTIQPLPVWGPPSLIKKRRFRGVVCKAVLSVSGLFMSLQQPNTVWSGSVCQDDSVHY